MSRELRKIAERLRSEKCPDHVLRNVQERCACDAKARRNRVIRWGFSGAIAFALVLIVWWPEPPAPDTPPIVENPDTDTTRQEVTLALAYLGKHLAVSGKEGGKVLADSSLGTWHEKLCRVHGTITDTNNDNQ